MSIEAEQQFNSVARNYARSAVHAGGPDLAWLREDLAPQAAWRVLDLGAGAGHASMAVAPLVATVDAVDISEEMLATATALARERGLANITFTRSAVETLPWEAGTFDAAFTRFSAHHWPALAAGLQEITRVLRPGAPLVVIDSISPEEPALASYLNTLELLRDPSHARSYAVSEWRRDLLAAGYTVAGMRNWTVPLEVESWLQRSATVPWRAEACRQLLRSAAPLVQSTLTIAAEGASFGLPAIVIRARRAS